MASVYDLKSKFQDLLRPLSNALHRLGVTPNMVTVFALLASLVTGFWIYQELPNYQIFYVLPVFLFIRMALNAIDGMLAREKNMTSKLGTYLNEIGDVLSDTALYLPFVFVAGLDPYLVLLSIFLAGLTELTGLVGLLVGAGRRYDGPMGKSDRAVAYSILGVYLALGFEAGPVTTYYLWALNVLLVLTVLNRIRKGVA